MMGKSYVKITKKTNAAVDQAPICPLCGARSWEATRPRRIREPKPPQDRKSWVERSVAMFAITFMGSGAIMGVAVLGAGTLPGWALWLLSATASAVLLSGLIAVDGIAVESKSCVVICKECGENFNAPWRPGA